jgi:hypothetical protein
MAAKAVRLDPKLSFDPSKPLANVRHERFCCAVVQGHRLGNAYEIAGFSGKSPRLPWELRHMPCVDARIRWLLTDRIESEAAIRGRAFEKELDARTRLIRELEAVAYVDLGDIVQWDRHPQFDSEGELIGWKDSVEITPSRLLTRAQRAVVKSITKHTTKNGTTLRIDTNGKLEALAQLARVLGLAALDTPQTVNGTQVNVQQVNVNAGEVTALEAARRLAFALEKAKQAVQTAVPDIEGSATGPLLSPKVDPVG